MSEFFKATAMVVVSILLTFLLLEGVLRLLPVNEGLRTQPVNEQNPVFHFEPNRVAQYSNHWNFDNRNSVRVNNFGFVSDNDYDPASRTPLLAVVGDSYVEAQMVPYRSTIGGRLHGAVAGKGRVYTFAASGAGLSQHMVWAKYARDTFRPDAFVFVIIANDFSESLARLEHSPGFHRFARSGDGWRMVRTDYEPSFIRRTARRSALAMYLMTNVRIHGKLSIPLSLGQGDARKVFVGNVGADASKKLLGDSEWATRVYLDNLPEWTGVVPGRIVFVLDGIRPELYREGGIESVTGAFWPKMRDYFMDQAKRRGYEVVDMLPRFISLHARTGKRFEFPTDSHWNAEGHGAASDAVAETRVWKELFGG